mmetsp:Transcript_81360/g.225263  ORF Transcript_81360/g.225263 Transcript_81360/m.225263 type:complete len:367 (-) Transcript_81360:162-1262(-)
MPPLQEWQLGVLASCLASLVGTLGGQLRVLSHASAGQGEARRARGLELFGWTIWITGQVIGQLAMVLAPATIIACVNFISLLLCNALLAPLVLQERFTWAHGLGLVLLSAGGSAVMETSAHTNQRYTLGELVAFTSRAPFLSTAACCLCLASVLAARSAQRAQLDPWSFAYAYALCGAVDMLVTKWTLLLLRLQLVAEAGEEPPASLVLASVGFMGILHMLIFGFQVVQVRYGEVLQNVPLFLGSGAMMQVALCGTFFDEFAEFSLTRGLIFVVGCIFMLVGLGITSRATVQAPPVLPIEEPLLVEPTKVPLPASTTAVLPPPCGFFAGEHPSCEVGQARSCPCSPCCLCSRVWYQLPAKGAEPMC